MLSIFAVKFKVELYFHLHHFLFFNTIPPSNLGIWCRGGVIPNFTTEKKVIPVLRYSIIHK